MTVPQKSTTFVFVKGWERTGEASDARRKYLSIGLVDAKQPTTIALYQQHVLEKQYPSATRKGSPHTTYVQGYVGEIEYEQASRIYSISNFSRGHGSLEKKGRNTYVCCRYLGRKEQWIRINKWKMQVHVAGESNYQYYTQVSYKFVWNDVWMLWWLWPLRNCLLAYSTTCIYPTIPQYGIVVLYYQR